MCYDPLLFRAFEMKHRPWMLVLERNLSLASLQQIFRETLRRLQQSHRLTKRRTYASPACIPLARREEGMTLKKNEMRQSIHE